MLAEFVCATTPGKVVWPPLLLAVALLLVERVLPRKRSPIRR